MFFRSAKPAALLHSTTHYYTLLHTTTHYYTLLHTTIHTVLELLPLVHTSIWLKKVFVNYFVSFILTTHSHIHKHNPHSPKTVPYVINQSNFIYIAHFIPECNTMCFTEGRGEYEHLFLKQIF